MLPVQDCLYNRDCDRHRTHKVVEEHGKGRLPVRLASAEDTDTRAAGAESGAVALQQDVQHAGKERGGGAGSAGDRRGDKRQPGA